MKWFNDTNFTNEGLISVPPTIESLLNLLDLTL